MKIASLLALMGGIGLLPLSLLLLLWDVAELGASFGGDTSLRPIYIILALGVPASCLAAQVLGWAAWMRGRHVHALKCALSPVAYFVVLVLVDYLFL